MLISLYLLTGSARYSNAMWLERFRRYLLPGELEKDEGFRQEIQRLAHLGLLVIGGAEIAIALFMLLARLLVSPDPEVAHLRILQGVMVVSVGLATLGVAKLKALYRWSRVLGICSGLAVAAVLIWFAILMTIYDPTADDFIPGQITLVVLVGVTAVPLRPTDTLLFGFLVECLYVLLTLAAQRLNLVVTDSEPIYVLFIFMLTLLAAGLTAVLYEQRRSNYQARLSTLRAAEHLRLSEARNLLAQNAASVGRLAAALSHELNSPVGALVSGVDTLLLLASRQATSSPQEQQRLVRLQADLRKSIKASTDRLKEIVARMQRFTNLDKAEVQAANLNEIVGDVAALLESRFKGKATVEMDLQPVPQLVCRPQQLSAVFSNLLGNAIEALNGNGRVVVTTRQKDSMVEVSIQDNGRGVPQAELDAIFDPGFKVTGGRVSTGNWSMFSSRQIVREHGGDISVASKPGEGTCIRVLLPAEIDPHSLSLT